MRLNLGSGRTNLPNMINVDIEQEGHDPDVILDIDNAGLSTWVMALFPDYANIPFNEMKDIERVEYAQLIHVIEHLHNPLKMMENLWCISKPDAICYVRCPHGGSDDAWEDPTHVRPYYPGSFYYFGQPTYWRADYGYRGDWKVVKMDLLAFGPAMLKNPNFAMMGRNSVREMVVTLQAVKPARPNDRELMDVIHPIYKAG